MAGQSVHVEDKFAKNLQHHIQTVDGPLLGFLLSCSVNDETVILGGAVKEGERSFESQYARTLDHLPLGLSICGIFFKTTQANVAPVIKPMLEKLCKSFGDIEDTMQSNEIYVLAVECTKGEHSALYSYNLSSKSLTQTGMISWNRDIHSSAVLVRMRCNLPISAELNQNDEKCRSNFLNEIVLLQDRIESSRTVFHVKNSSILISSDEESSSDTVRNVLAQITWEDLDEFARKKQLKAGNYSQEILPLEMLCDISVESDEISHSPFIIHEHKNFTRAQLVLPIEIAGYADPDAPISTLHSLLLASVKIQLETLAKTSLKHYKSQKLVQARPYSFKPPSLSHLITVTYPDLDEANLESTRRVVHKMFLLPENQPLVKKSNAFRYADERGEGGILVNTHLGLGSPGVPNGVQYLVQGTYSYHHYMQDRFDDNGWGCAYRSLQTLMSWFRHQGYTARLPASHREIQQALLDIGDKEPKFVGSKQWIGSTEVSFVLDHLLDVTSKILFVNSGAELGSKGRELAVHFESQGTPIMIGGGVLAHTILGVEWDEVTGDVKFLILDPHYTGGEDLKVIQDKGWCGWKGPDFWDKNAHYNLCMPQRPEMM